MLKTTWPKKVSPSGDDLPSVLLITKENDTAAKLRLELTKWGFTCLVANIKDKVVERVVRDAPELTILEMDGQVSQIILHELTGSTKIRRKSPVIALLNAEILNQPGDFVGADDFIVKPYNEQELVARARRLLQKNNRGEEILQHGDLVIDLANCEVRVEGKIVELTFKEFELLKFLAQDQGRVFTRETLLNKVWGYDYFGGDRTVDVHVRRLRSKIELSGQTFIETVRNIGYRFKKSKS
jgi:two-component system, OmpR family, alkaline phosphatase synthesis response regulator PhoP